MDLSQIELIRLPVVPGQGRMDWSMIPRTAKTVLQQVQPLLGTPDTEGYHASFAARTSVREPGPNLAQQFRQLAEIFLQCLQTAG